MNEEEEELTKENIDVAIAYLSTLIGDNFDLDLEVAKSLLTTDEDGYLDVQPLFVGLGAIALALITEKADADGVSRSKVIQDLALRLNNTFS